MSNSSPKTKKRRNSGYPVPEDILDELRRRKVISGQSITRSLEDALRVSLRPEIKKIWF